MVDGRWSIVVAFHIRGPLRQEDGVQGLYYGEGSGDERKGHEWVTE